MGASQSPLIYDIILTPLVSPAATETFLDAREIRTARSVVAVPYGEKGRALGVARNKGAIVLRGRRRGRGDAIAAAIMHLQALPDPPDAVVLAAADGRCNAASSAKLIRALRREGAELALGVSPGADPRQHLVLSAIRALYRVRYSAFPHHFAIRFPALVALGLSSRGDGVDAEVLVKAAKLGLHSIDVPLDEERGRGAAIGANLLQVLRHSTSR